MNARTVKLVLAGFACALIAAFLVPSQQIDASGTYRGAVRDAVARVNGLLSRSSGQVPTAELRAAVLELHRSVQAFERSKRGGAVVPCSPICGCSYGCGLTNPTGQLRPGTEEAGALLSLVEATRTNAAALTIENLRPLGAQLAAWAAK